MIFGKEKALKQQIIEIGRKLSQTRLVVAASGNLSLRFNDDEILITATGTSLGDLKDDDIIKVNIKDEEQIKIQPLSTEFPLHRMIYENFPAKCVIHCHPPLINGYFAVYSDLKALTFESKLYLGQIVAVPQETPNISKPELVIEALKSNSLAVIKNHGVVSIADDFKKAFDLIDTLEEAVKVTAVARLFDKTVCDDLEKILKDELSAKAIAFPMFSHEHIQAIVDLVNQDEFIAKKGQEMDLTLDLAIKLDDENKAFRFVFEKGKIVNLEPDCLAPFIVSGPAVVWEQVFLGKLDSFVAVTQGKMKLKGDLGKLSRWYVPFSRLFELFKQVKIK